MWIMRIINTGVQSMRRLKLWVWLTFRHSEDTITDFGQRVLSLKTALPNNSVFPELEATGQLMMRFGANLIGNHAKMSFKNTMIRGEGKKDSGWFKLQSGDTLNNKFKMQGVFDAKK